MSDLSAKKSSSSTFFGTIDRNIFLHQFDASHLVKDICVLYQSELVLDEDHIIWEAPSYLRIDSNGEVSVFAAALSCDRVERRPGTFPEIRGNADFLVENLQLASAKGAPAVWAAKQTRWVMREKLKGREVNVNVFLPENVPLDLLGPQNPFVRFTYGWEFHLER